MLLGHTCKFTNLAPPYNTCTTYKPKLTFLKETEMYMTVYFKQINTGDTHFYTE